MYLVKCSKNRETMKRLYKTQMATLYRIHRICVTFIKARWIFQTEGGGDKYTSKMLIYTVVGQDPKFKFWYCWFLKQKLSKPLVFLNGPWWDPVSVDDFPFLKYKFGPKNNFYIVLVSEWCQKELTDAFFKIFTRITCSLVHPLEISLNILLHFIRPSRPYLVLK